MQVTIYNLKDHSYDVRIRTNSYSRYYQVIDDSIQAYPTGEFPKKRVNPIQTTWEELDLKVRKFHFSRIFPNGTSHKEYIEYIYGKNAKKILDFENWLNSQNFIPASVGWKLYKKIGIFEKPILVGDFENVKIYLVNKLWYVTVHKKTQKCVIQSREEYNKNSSERLNKISEEVNLPCDIVAIIKMIDDDNVAINILNRLKNLNSNSNVMQGLKKFTYYNEQNKEIAAKIESDAVKKELEKEFGEKTFSQMDLGKNKFTKLAEYLLNS